MSGKRSRDKGARGEREAIELLKPLWDLKRKRDQDAEGGEDLLGSPFTIEVKRQKRPSIGRAIRQAEAAAEKTGRPPMAVTKEDYRPWLITMHAEAFIQFVMDVHEQGYQEGSETGAETLMEWLGSDEDPGLLN